MRSTVKALRANCSARQWATDAISRDSVGFFRMLLSRGFIWSKVNDRWDSHGVDHRHAQDSPRRICVRYQAIL